MTMNISPHGAYALACHEGLVPGPYKDSVGVWTFGIGHTAAAGDPDPATLPRGMPADLNTGIDRALALFVHDLASYVDAVNRAVKVPVSQSEFDALVSFHYNTGAIARATLTKTLNAGDHAKAGDQFMNWVTPPEVKSRRQAEKDLFKLGKYPDKLIPVWGVDTAGKVIWKVQKSIGYDQFLAAVTPKVAPAPIPVLPPQFPPSETSGLFAHLGAVFASIFGGTKR